MTETPTLSELTSRIEALQARGAQDADPAGFCFLQQQRERLAQLRHLSPRSLTRLAEAATRLEQRMEHPADPPRPDAPAPSPLAALVTALRQSGGDAAKPENRDPLRAMLQAQEGGLLDDEAALQQASDGPRELKALSRVRAGQQQQRKRRRIEEALTQTPSDAGPLNSHRLVTRAISAIKDLSPAYLDHFVNYVDTLMVLEKVGRKRG